MSIKREVEREKVVSRNQLIFKDLEVLLAADATIRRTPRWHLLTRFKLINKRARINSAYMEKWGSPFTMS